MSTFTDTTRQMWETRPPRIPADQGGNSHIAGVSEGIGVRYQIDPTIVRVIFVVSAFTLGGGLVAYLLAWLMMPRYGMTTSPAEAIGRRKEQLDPTERKERTAGWWLLIFILVFSFSSTGLALPAVALLLAAWWLLHAKEPAPPAGLLAAPSTRRARPSTPGVGGIPFAQTTESWTSQQAPGPTMQQPVDLSGFAPAEGYPAPPGRTTPPSWDPLGAAPFAWDLPEPGPEPAPKRRKARVWPWVMLGIGAVLASLVAAISLFFGAFSPVQFDEDLTGSQRWAPTTGQELREAYDGGIGDTDLDLRDLAPLSEDREIEISGGIGEMNVHLPTNVPVELECSSGLGDFECREGLYNEGAEGGTLTLTVDAGIGQTNVHSAS